MFAPMAATETPGSALRRLINCALNAAMLSSIGYRAFGSERFIVRTPCGSKPSGAFCARQKLFNVSPAAANKINASAICATTRTARIRCRLVPSLTARPAPLMQFKRKRTDAGDPQRWPKSDEHAGECGNAGRESERDKINSRFVKARNVARAQCDDGVE